METFKESKAAYFSYLIISFIWFSSLLVGALFLIVMALPLVTNSVSLSGINLNFPISTEVLLFAPDSNTEDFMNIDSAIASVSLGYVVENFPSTYLILTGILLVAVGITIYGIYLLRSVLKDLRQDKVFILDNIIRIKKMAVVILALSPIEWIYYLILTQPFSGYIQNYGSVELNIGSANFGYITVGLLIYTLGLIFERGYHQHEELKLTV